VQLRSVERVGGAVGGLPIRVAGALAYCILPAVIFLLVEPYKKNRFVRFHSLQGIACLLACSLIGAALWIVGSAMGLIPVLALLFVSMLLSLAFLVAWMTLVVKALQGEMLKVPFLGAVAETQADVRIA
jgi:uncharacterized membrane protein